MIFLEFFSSPLKGNSLVAFQMNWTIFNYILSVLKEHVQIHLHYGKKKPGRDRNFNTSPINHSQRSLKSRLCDVNYNFMDLHYTEADQIDMAACRRRYLVPSNNTTAAIKSSSFVVNGEVI